MPKKPQHMNYRELRLKLAASPNLRWVLQARRQQMQGLAEAARYAQSTGGFKLTLKPKEPPMTGIDSLKLGIIHHGAFLAALYNRAKPQGFGLLQHTPEDMDMGAALEILQTRRVGDVAYFDYLGGRVLKVAFRYPEEGGSPSVSGSHLYDRDNGEGAFREVYKACLESEPYHAGMLSIPASKMGRYLVFSGEHYEVSGGAHDLAFGTNDLHFAEQWAMNESKAPAQWSHVLDTSTGEFVS